jgi:protein TonB
VPAEARRVPTQARRRPETVAIGPGERVRVAVLFSLILHAVVVLGVTFTYEDPAPSLPSLDVILVPSSTTERPDKADFLANAGQQGGGDSDEARRPRQPTTSPVPKATPGLAPTPLRASAPAPRPPSPTPVLASRDSAMTVERARDAPEVPELPQLTGRELIERSMEMARLAAEIERQSELYAKRPKRKFISANTQEYVYAAYMRAWVARVERIGNVNYPDEARRRKIAGQLVLTVAVRANGTVERVDIIQPSGFPVLDQAAVEIVKLGEPYAPLPRGDDQVDILHITRTWQFLPGGTLGTR